MSMPPRNKRKERSSPEPQTQPPSEIPTSFSAADNLSSSSMKPYLLPPGYMFVPSDEDLLNHYLKPFSPDRKIYPSFNIPIHHVNIYNSNPKQLSEEFEKGNKEAWFFITERKTMGKGGKNQKRGDNRGYWNVTVGAKKINTGQGGVGYKTALEYCVGKQPNGVKTDWLMHEYWFESSDDNDNEKVDYALCKIYLTPKAVKRKRAEMKEDEKLKKEKGVLKEEVEQLDLHQPNQSQLQQPHDNVYQPPQDCLLPAQHLINEKVDYALCKIYLTPKAAKRKKAEMKEDEKLKKEEGVLKEEVEQLDLHQPDQSQLQQPHDTVYQPPQDCLLPAQHLTNEKVDHALCKIYLTPKAAKKKKADIKEDEKLKKEESVLKEEVKQLDLHQPDQSQLQQPHDIVYQPPQDCLLPAQHQEPQPQPFRYNFDDFSEFINFEQEPVIPDDFEDFLTEFIKSHSLDGDEEPNTSGLFEGFVTEGMMNHYTN